MIFAPNAPYPKQKQASGIARNTYRSKAVGAKEELSETNKPLCARGLSLFDFLLGIPGGMI